MTTLWFGVTPVPIRKIDQLNVRLSASLDLATYETKIQRFFFRSLPHHPSSTHVERLSIQVQGPECYHLLADIHNGGVKYLSFFSTCPEKCNPPMVTSAIGGTLGDLHGIDLQNGHSFLPILTWMFSSIISSAATLKILSVTRVSLDSAQWRQLLLSGHTFPALKECKFDISISFAPFMELGAFPPLSRENHRS